MSTSNGKAADAAPTLQAFVSAANREHIESQLGRLLQADASINNGGLQTAIQWCRQQQADVLLVDLDGYSNPIDGMRLLLSHCDPACRVIAVGHQPDINLYRSLQRLGVIDYLALPLPLDLLATAINLARTGQTWQYNGHSGRTIAITGAVGGVGTSTLAAALAQTLADDCRIPTALVDYDQQKSDQLLYLGDSSSASLGSVMATPNIDQRLLQRSLGQISERLSLISQGQEEIPDVTTEQVFQFGSALCQLANLVLWDIPAARPAASMDVLRAAQVRILVTEYSVNAARQTRLLLDQIGDESDGQQLFVVASPAHGKGVVSRSAFAEFIGREVDFELPDVGNTLANNLLQGPLGKCSQLNPVLDQLVGQISGQQQSGNGNNRGLKSLLGKFKRSPRRQLAEA